MSGTAVTLTLATAVTNGQTVTLAYSGTAVQDAAGNSVAALTAQTVTNNTPAPVDTTAQTLSTAVVNGTTLTLTYDEALAGTPAATDYTKHYRVAVNRRAWSESGLTAYRGETTIEAPLFIFVNPFY